MLIEFTFGNFKSFRNSTTISFVPTGSTDKPENITPITIKGRKNKKVNISKMLAIYGKNASGKSCVVLALEFFASFILDSAKKYDAGDNIPVHPFKLSNATVSEPSFFEAVFVDSCILYRYGFECDKNSVVKEWLYWAPKGSEAKIFERENEDVILGRDFLHAKASTSLIRNNSLFISVASQTNMDFGKSVVSFFKKFIIYDPNEIDNSFSVLGDLAKEEYLSIIQSALNYADVGIRNVRRKEPTEQELLEWAKKTNLSSEDLQKFLDAKNEGTSFLYRLEFEHTSVEESTNHFFTHLDESVGTIKYMALIAIAIRAFMKGGVIIIDEIDASLHSDLSSSFIRLFSSICSHNAQILFTTHNTNLLNEDLFRRDQVWIADKNISGVSKLTCVSEFSTRKDSNLEKLYLSGHFGGTPVLHHGHQEEMLQRFRAILEKHFEECEVSDAR